MISVQLFCGPQTRLPPGRRLRTGRIYDRRIPRGRSPPRPNQQRIAGWPGVARQAARGQGDGEGPRGDDPLHHQGHQALNLPSGRAPRRERAPAVTGSDLPDSTPNPPPIKRRMFGIQKIDAYHQSRCPTATGRGHITCEEACRPQLGCHSEGVGERAKTKGCGRP